MANMTQASQKPKFSVAITTEGYQKLINNTLGDPNRAKRFISAITSAVAVNPALQECDAGSILAGALLGESLNLSPSPQLGQYYLVPFENKVKENGKTVYLRDEKGNILKDDKGKWIALTEKKAQFVLGYKGYIQLALRSGYYADLDVLVIHEGEYKGRDRRTGKPIFEFFEDEDYAETQPVIGYMAYYEYLNGFVKNIYWSKDKVMRHADKYAPAFSAEAYQKLLAGEIPEKEMWRYSSDWYGDFDGMAKKTMIRQLISRWGVMSTELQTAFEKDSSVNDFSSKGDIIPVASDDNSDDNAEPPAISESTSNNPNVVPEASNVVEQASLDDFE